MRATIVTLAFVSALAVAVDVGGPHGNYSPAKKLHRRLRRRGTCKVWKSDAAAAATPTATPVAEQPQAQAQPVAVAEKKKKVEPKVEAPAPAEDKSTNEEKPAGSANGLQALRDRGINRFLTLQSGAIGSWFLTNAGSDSTNGKSWCQQAYRDDWMGFALSYNDMMENFGWDEKKAGEAYCGAEILATNPANGNTARLYLVDAFDNKWTITPNSLDLTVAAFTALFGRSTSSKMDVIKDLHWEFTGHLDSGLAYSKTRNW